MFKYHPLLVEQGLVLPKELQSEKKRIEILKRLKQSGVMLPDNLEYSDVYVESTAKIEPGTWIGPHNYIFGDTVIKAGTAIGPMNVIKDMKIGKRCRIKSFCDLANSEIRDDCTIGSYAHVQDNSQVRNKAEIGKAEVVRSIIGEGTIIKHEAYIGDANVGERCNIGADTKHESKPKTGKRVVVCNYDGRTKHKTIVEDDVFVGSGTKIIARRRIGAKAFIAAHSLITKDVPRGEKLGYLVKCRNGKQIMEPNRVKRDKNGWTILKI